METRSLFNYETVLDQRLTVGANGLKSSISRSVPLEHNVGRGPIDRCPPTSSVCRDHLDAANGARELGDAIMAERRDLVGSRLEGDVLIGRTSRKRICFLQCAATFAFA